jgi:hypothetical protein
MGLLAQAIMTARDALLFEGKPDHVNGLPKAKSEWRNIIFMPDNNHKVSKTRVVSQFQFSQSSQSPSACGKLFGMKKKLRPKGEWQAIGMQEARLEKGSPEKLRMRARQLRDHAERLSREAEELEERAAVAEKAAVR